MTFYPEREPIIFLNKEVPLIPKETTEELSLLDYVVAVAQFPSFHLLAAENRSIEKLQMLVMIFLLGSFLFDMCEYFLMFKLVLLFAFFQTTDERTVDFNHTSEERNIDVGDDARHNHLVHDHFEIEESSWIFWNSTTHRDVQ